MVATLISSPHDQVSFDAISGIYMANAATAPTREALPELQKAQSLIGDGLKATEDKQYEQAIRTFKNAIGNDPKNAAAWHGLGSRTCSWVRPRRVLWILRKPSSTILPKTGSGYRLD